MAGFSNRIAALRELSSELDSFAAKVGESTSTIGTKLDELTNKSDQLHHRTTWLEDDKVTAEKSLDVLGDLYAKNETVQNDWSEKFQLGIEAVRIGAQDIRDFIATWGDAQIATKDGFQTIREAFSGADLGQYQQQLQALIGDVTSGAAKLDDVLGFLKANAGDLAAGLVNVLELFKAGKASLEDVQRVLDATKATFPGADADALADAINAALLGGTL
jgi:hypothetical protein